MKVLFLDIDGVVNCATTAQRHRGAIGIDPYMAFLVGRLVDRTGCKVVLSSTWRLWEESREEVKKQVCDFMDVTPYLPLSGGAEMCERGKEIKAWLDKWDEGTLRNAPKHTSILNETVTAYAILDDDSDMLPEQMPNFFKTSWATGITEEIADAVEKHLTK